MTEELGKGGDLPVAAERLVGYVRAAAQLRLQMHAFERDRDNICGGKKIIYCVDTNILTLFLRPDKIGPLSDGRNGYGVVFPEDDRELSASLAAALSRYIFFELMRSEADSHAIPLILLTGHDVEARRVYDILAGQVGNYFERISEWRSSLLSLIEDTFSSQSQTNVDIKATEFFELIFASDDVVKQYNRFNDLIRYFRIGRLSALVPAIVQRWDGDLSQNYRAALMAPSTIHDQIEESAYRLAWLDRLKSEKSSARSERRLRFDVAALARLELVNRKLDEFGASLILITGDAAMHRAGRKYCPFGQHGDDFARLYLRHPQAFLSSTQILVPEESPSLEPKNVTSDMVVDWLDSFLVPYMNYDGPKLDALKNIAYGEASAVFSRIAKSASISNIPTERIKEEWGKHTTIVREQHAISSSIAQSELERILGRVKIGQFREAIDELDKLLLYRSEVTWQSFFEAIVHAGWDIFWSNGNSAEIRSRNAPASVFNSFPATSAFVRRALENKPREGDLRADLQRCLPLIDKEDPFGYAKMLAYATLHASYGNWYVARLLSVRAISIAERIVRERGEEIVTWIEGTDEDELVKARAKISGREAYYFAAVAKRHCARSPADLDEVPHLLDKARDALHVDLLRKDPPMLDNLRFEAEGYATVLTQILFERFGAASSDRVDLNNRLLVLESSFARIVDRCHEISDPWIRENVRRNALINLFMANSLLSGTGRASTIDYQKYFFLLLESLKKKSGGNEPKIAETWLVKAVSLYACAKFCAIDSITRRSLKDDISTLELSTRDLERNVFVMPYDRRRFRFLIDSTTTLVELRKLPS